MANKIISFFTTNIVWKITALILACVLWVIAVNIEDPLENRLFHSVRVGFENMETLERLGLVLLNQEEIERSTVSVRLWANRRFLNQLESSDMRAYVDLSSAIFGQVDWVGETISAPINLQLPTTAAANIINDTVMPANVRLIIDRLDSREFPISVVKMGDPLVGYISMEPRIDPHVVQITGASTVLDSIVHVRTQVELTDASEDYTVTGRLVVYNENNIDITDRVTLEPAEITVFIPINRRGQVPVRVPSFIGSLPAGYVITNIQIEPAHIDVVGTAEDIESFGGIVLEAIDISGLTSTVTFQQDARDFLLATPLSIQNSRPHEIGITLVIEREAVREFAIPNENIGITGELADNFTVELPEYFNLRLIGVTRIINAVDIDSISLSVNIANLYEGVHNIPVNLILPDGVRRADAEVNLRVVVSGETSELTLEEETEPNIEEDSEDDEEDSPLDLDTLETSHTP